MPAFAQDDDPQAQPDPSPSPSPVPDEPDHHHDNFAWGWIILIVILLFLVAALAYVLYAHWRARRLGLPAPRLNPFSDDNRIPSRIYPARGGFVGWIQHQFRNLKNRRTAGGNYEGTQLADGGGEGGSARGRRGFGRLDPDEAWDTRVGNEADAYGSSPYYEEQEAGLHQRQDSDGNGVYPSQPRTGYGPTSGLSDIQGQDGRGRSRARSELDERYEEATARGHSPGQNPFGDAAEPSSLRGVSPRPHLETRQSGHKSKASIGPDDSPTERRSMFREDV